MIIPINSITVLISKNNHAEEVVANKDYHLNVVMVSLEGREVRSYISEPKRRHRNWEKKIKSRKQPTYATVVGFVASLGICSGNPTTNPYQLFQAVGIQ